jgi:MFS family permease
VAIAKGDAKVAPIFTKLNRRIIRVKHTSGYLGVAALTPLVLTIPLGGILAARFFHHDRRTLPAMLLSVVVQALCVTAVLTGFVGQLTG